jgi:hypothetical protein
MDTQDIAKFCLRALQTQTTNQTFLLGGSRAWVSEIINLCEQLAGQQAKTFIPLFFLKFVSRFFGF